MTSGIRIRGDALPSQGTSALSNQPPSPGPAARAEGKRSLARDLSWAAFGLVIGVLAMRASNSCVRPGVVSHEPASADTLLAPADSAKHPSSRWKRFGVWMDKHNGPIPEKARKPTLVLFICGTIVAGGLAGVYGCQAGWKWGLLLLTTQVAFLSSVAGSIFPARWTSLITVISLIGTLVGFGLSPPVDTTPNPIHPVTWIDGKEYTGSRECWFDTKVEDPTEGYTCYLSVSPSHPSSTTTPLSAPAK